MGVGRTGRPLGPARCHRPGGHGRPGAARPADGLGRSIAAFGNDCYDEWERTRIQVILFRRSLQAAGYSPGRTVVLPAHGGTWVIRVTPPPGVRLAVGERVVRRLLYDANFQSWEEHFRNGIANVRASYLEAAGRGPEGGPAT